jgi:tetratricopeptide (TPR) repeat protein
LDAELWLMSLVSEALELAERKFEANKFRRRLAQRSPEDQNNLFQLSVLLAGIGEVDESLAYCRRLLELNRNHLGAAANFLLSMNYSDR